jgi:hypothetical protein
MNDPDIKKLPIGSICGHGTAEAIAKLHSILANGGVYQGKQLLSEESLEVYYLSIGHPQKITFNIKTCISFTIQIMYQRSVQ